MKMQRVIHSAILVTGLTGALLSVSCSNQTPPPPPVTSDVGRFQVILASEGDRGAVLFLLDSKDGSTWIYRPPQGPAINGFWSDIPRITYPPEFWQRAFTSMAQPPPNTGTTGGTSIPAPTP